MSQIKKIELLLTPFQKHVKYYSDKNQHGKLQTKTSCILNFLVKTRMEPLTLSAQTNYTV